MLGIVKNINSNAREPSTIHFFFVANGRSYTRDTLHGAQPNNPGDNYNDGHFETIHHLSIHNLGLEQRAAHTPVAAAGFEQLRTMAHNLQ